MTSEDVMAGAATPSLTQHNWKLLPYGVIRMAGFTFERLSALADPHVGQAATELLHVRERTRLSRRSINASSFSKDHAGGDATDAEQAQPQSLRDAEKSFEAAYSELERRSSAHVVRTFQNDYLLLDMLRQSNEVAYPRFLQWLADPGDSSSWKSRDRKYMDRLTSYLQRVCAKNDTTSHFGPFAPAELFHDADGLAISWGPRQRIPTIARWAVEEMATSLSKSPVIIEHYEVRRSPNVYFADAGDSVQTFVLDHRRRRPSLQDCVAESEQIPWNALDAVIWSALAESSLTVRALLKDRAVLSHCEGRTDLLEQRLFHLVGLGVCHIGPTLPYGEACALHDLAQKLPAVEAAQPWRQALQKLDTKLLEYSTCRLQDREGVLSQLQERVIALAPSIEKETRSGFYSDRSIVYEDCIGPVTHVRVGAKLSTGLEANLRDICELFMVRPRVRFAHERRIISEWFAGRFASRSVDCREYLRTYIKDYPSLQAQYAALDEDLRAIDQLLLKTATAGTAENASRVQANRDDLLAAVNRLSNGEPAVCNPDVMIAAASTQSLSLGDYEIVVGDLHADEENLTHGAFAPHLRNCAPNLSAEVTRQYTRLLGPDETLVDVTLNHRNKTFARWSLYCPDVELTDPSPHGPAAIPFSRLRIRLQDGTVALHDGDARLRLRLVTLPLAWSGIEVNPFTPFGFPKRDGQPVFPVTSERSCPRIAMGKIILQRQRWSIPPSMLVHKDRIASFLAIQEVRAQKALPRHVYYKSTTEPKPMYCDLDSPLLVRQLVRVAKNATTDLAVEEMFPNPEQLWLEAPEGRVTSELRCSMFDVGRAGRN